MATPQKIRKTEDHDESSETAAGYVHDVSPMLTSAKGFPYFNAKIQEKTQVTSIVGYNENMRKDLLEIENQRTPIKISKIERVSSWKNRGSFDIKLTRWSQFSPKKLDFQFEKPAQEDQKPKAVTIDEAKHLPEQAKVNVTAKVLKRVESSNQVVRNKTMQRTEFVIADMSSSIDLTFWGPHDHIKEGNTYQFENLTVKIFATVKKLSTNPHSKIHPATPLEDVADLPAPKNTSLNGHIKGATITTTNNCSFCRAILVVNEELTSVKCTTCMKRQLVTSIHRERKCEIHMDTEDGEVMTLDIPNDVLAVYTLGIDDDNDKELFLLQHNHVKVEVYNKAIIKMQEIL